MPLRIRIARAVALLLLLPAGMICIGFPFYRLTLPGGWAIVEDTRAAFGAGSDAGRLKAAHVDCVRERSGSNSSRGIGMTEYACVIDLSEKKEKAYAAPTGNAWAGRSWEEGMAEHSRRINAQIEAMGAQRSRSTVSNRIERRLATNRTGELPAVRILSGKDEPRRVGLVWGFGELGWRWASWLVSSLLFLAFGGFCLLAVRLAWKKR